MPAVSPARTAGPPRRPSHAVDHLVGFNPLYLLVVPAFTRFSIWLSSVFATEANAVQTHRAPGDGSEISSGARRAVQLLRPDRLRARLSRISGSRLRAAKMLPYDTPRCSGQRCSCSCPGFSSTYTTTSSDNAIWRGGAPRHAPTPLRTLSPQRRQQVLAPLVGQTIAQERWPPGTPHAADAALRCGRAPEGRNAQGSFHSDLVRYLFRIEFIRIL